MNIRTVACAALLLLAPAVQAGNEPAKSEVGWTQDDVNRIAGLSPADRRAELKAMSPHDRRGLWFAVMTEVRANKGSISAKQEGGGQAKPYASRFGKSEASAKPARSARVQGPAGTGLDKRAARPKAVGTIQYDDNVGNTTFGGGAIIGNRFDTYQGDPVLASGSVTNVQAVVVQGPAFTTSSAGFVLLGPQTVGGGAFAIFSSFTGATGVTDTVEFTGIGANYTGSSFFVLFGDFANSYVPAFGTGTNLGQGHHGVVGYTGGMGPNITGTFDFGGALNALVRTSGNILPVELMSDLGVTKTDGMTSALVGAPVTYTIVGSNAGPGDVVGATLADTFPAELTGCTWTCVAAGGAVCAANGAGNINDLVDLPQAGSVTYTANCTLGAATPAGTTVSNTATIAPPGGITDPNAANDSATDDTLATSPATITATKTVTPVGGAFVEGGGVVYTIVISNAGPGVQLDNPGDEFVDILPAGLAFGSVNASSGTAVFASGAVSWNGSIPAASSVTITINATIIPGTSGAVVNQGTVNFDADGDGANDSTAMTDNPVAPGAADATSFFLTMVVPGNAPWALLLLIVLTLVTVAWRRRGVGSSAG